MNTEMFIKVAELVEQDRGEHYNQDNWTLKRKIKKGSAIREIAKIHKANIPNCYSPSCVAGFTALLTLEKGEYLKGAYIWKDDEMIMYIAERAQYALGINSMQRRILFTALPEAVWPAPYRALWDKAETHAERAGITANFLRDIANGKVLL